MSIFNQSETEEIRSTLNQLEQSPQTSEVINLLKRGEKLLGIDSTSEVTRLTEVMPITRVLGVQRLIITPNYRQKN